MNRRSFLTLLAGGASIVAAAPVRRIWAVGATLELPGVSFNLLGKHISRKGASVSVISQRWHESDLVRELQAYRSGGEDPPEPCHIARAALEMRDALPTTFPTDVRFAKSSASQLYSPADVKIFIGDMELEPVDPIEFTYQRISPNGTLLGPRS